MCEDMSEDDDDEEALDFGPTNRLEDFLLGTTHLMCNNRESDWISRTIIELRHLLIDAGICCVELKLVLEKVNSDLVRNITAIRSDVQRSVQFNQLAVRERYMRITPAYMQQLFDESINQDLIGVWIDAMVDGSHPLPGKLPNILGQMAFHKDPEWAEKALEPSQEWGDMRLNPELRYEVFRRVGLI